MPDKIAISLENAKIGPCLNVSLPPAQTCHERRCARDCYARKGQCASAPSRAAWDRNWSIWTTSPTNYFKQIAEHITRAKRISRFRFHVGGDIPNAEYLVRMRFLAIAFPKVSFTAYTKAWYDRPEIAHVLGNPSPPNLRLWLSCWPAHGYAWGLSEKWPLPAGLHGRFWTLSKDEKRPFIAKNIFECKGYCPTCLRCWTARRDSQIMIYRH